MRQTLRCMVVDDDSLSRTLLTEFIEKDERLTLVGCMSDAVSASNFLNTNSVDVIFLDVEMPYMSGLDWLKSLTKRPNIVLVSGTETYAVDAFNVQVDDFLLKPVLYSRFLKAVQVIIRNRARMAESAEQTDETVFIKANGRLIKVRINNMHYVEAQGDYVNIKTEEKAYLVHSTLKAMLKKLPADRFAQAHRSYLVNINHIKDIEDGSILIENKVIPVGATYKNSLMEKLNVI